jgi:hypothetical protein
VTGDALPRLLVLDDREGLVRSSPGNAVLTSYVGWTVVEVFTESAAIAARQVDDHLARRLDPSELLDPQVVPANDALGGVLGAPP